MRLLSIALVALAIATTVVAAGCGSGSTSTPAAGGAASGGSAATTSATSSVHFAKTKFVLHAGLAFGAFHRYIYKPFKQGQFSGGLLHHKLATIKAGLAAAFAYHEVKLALQDARSSRVLSKALSPLLAMQSKLQTMEASFKQGTADPAAIAAANGAAAQTSHAGAQAGQPVPDQPTPQP